MRITPVVIALLLGATCTAAAAEDTATPAAAESSPEAATSPPANCLQETGSRIQRPADQPCIAAPGQVITREELDRTGATTVSDALRRSSPAVH